MPAASWSPHWDDTGSANVDKIPDRYVVLRSGLDRPGWPYVVAWFATIPFMAIFAGIAYGGVVTHWGDFCNFLRARLPRR